MTYDPFHLRPTYVGEYTGKGIHPMLVREATIDELKYLNLRVWHIAHVNEMKQHDDDVRTKFRSIGCSKGDDESTDISFRLVSCEDKNIKGKARGAPREHSCAGGSAPDVPPLCVCVWTPQQDCN